jgi:multicomponent Na+:H+ antiporter subunit D
MNLLLPAPILIPFLTAVLSLFAWNRRSIQRTLSVVGAAALLGAGVGLLATVWKAGIRAIQVGNWPSPFGITLAADLFSAIMVVMAGLMGLSVAVYSLGSMDSERESFGYYPLLHFLLMGVNGSFLTGDIFNLYVWFEVMLISSFVLLELGGEKAQLEGAVKYVALNFVSSALFLTAVGILYGALGTLNLADLARQIQTLDSAGFMTTVAILFFLALGIKAAVFPLFFWLPASYHTSPVPISAIFAGLLTKVGVYALIRVFTLLFVHDPTVTHGLILIIAALTMLSGVLGAVAQFDFRRLLSFHIISQIGYMIMGLGFYTPLALTGAIFFIVHNIFAKTNLFLISGCVYRLEGSYDLKKLGGLHRKTPWLGLLFLIPALSLAGVPPSSGFWGKLVLVQSGLAAGDYAVVAVALLVSLLTLYSMTKIWNEVFWKNNPEADGRPSAHPACSRATWTALILPVILLALLSLAIGLGAESLLLLASRAAEQLMNPAEYISQVLGEIG